MISKFENFVKLRFDRTLNLKQSVTHLVLNLEVSSFACNPSFFQAFIYNSTESENENIVAELPTPEASVLVDRGC